MMETVGLLVILAVVDVSSLSSFRRERCRAGREDFAIAPGASARLAQPPNLGALALLPSFLHLPTIFNNHISHVVAVLILI